MPEPAFDYLSGTVRVPSEAPAQWAQEGLGAFYQDPNEARWGRSLCRVLYHESVHFWQFLASAYLANLVAEEWHRLRAFDDTGTPPPQGAAGEGFLTGSPFSAHELTECWARYWDVHTRSPTNVIAEDESLADAARRLDLPAERRGYLSAEFDLVMRAGRDCEIYAAPYRWALEEPGSNSYLVALTFPILCHAAFGSPEPVEVFVRCFERAVHDRDVRGRLLGSRSGNINMDWLGAWGTLHEGVIGPVLMEGALPSFTSGFDVIHRSRLLTDHHVFRRYLERSQFLQAFLAFQRDHADATPHDPRLDAGEIAALWNAAVDQPWLTFALPGQPVYRASLGTAMPPPLVEFANLSVEDPHGGMSALQERVRRFRRAERAVALGLPATAFEAAA